jgi:hypothetical protein
MLSKLLSTITLVCMLHATPAVAADWSGFYAGINITSNTVEADWTTTEIREPNGDIFRTTSNPEASLESTETGNGLLAGYNWNIDNWVFGLEASTGSTKHAESIDDRIPGLGSPGSDPNSFVELKIKTDGLVLRARGGYLVTSDLLLYGTLGSTSLEVEITSVCPADFFVCNPADGVQAYRNTGDEYASAIGVGAEYAFNSLRVRAQYSYANFSDSSFTALPEVDGSSFGADAQIDFAAGIVQLGVSYNF